MTDVSQQEMSIGAFARLTNLTHKALLVYEHEGLLGPARIDPSNGYRWYEADQVEQARLIGLLRGLHMPLEVIAELLRVDTGVASMQLAAWWQLEEREHASRRSLAAHIQSVIRDEESTMYEVQTRHVPARRVMSVQRRVYQPELEQFILDSWEAFNQHLAAGQQAGEFTVIYHGRVDAELDGPVEAIMGCPESTPASDTIGIRTEPAHDVAYTRLTKGQFQFPEILGAYDAVATSPEVQRRGISPLGPREMYLAPWEELADTDPAGDIAFPLA